MSRIHKSSNFEDIPAYDREYWWAKTPQERLAAALKLIRRAKAIYYANPANPPLGNAGKVIKSSHRSTSVNSVRFNRWTGVIGKIYPTRPMTESVPTSNRCDPNGSTHSAYQRKRGD